jgi:SAM-dependent methyltransferase
MADGHVYDRYFFDSIARGAERSAAAVVPMVARTLAPESVLDIGCGRGIWVRQWIAVGVDALGVDGAYVANDLVVPRERFRAVDLTLPFDLGRRFDLVQCLEVAEHLPENAGAALVATIVSHGDVVLFSAAVPGQGGEHHVNEQSREYWRDLFGRHGYRAFDALRPRIARDRRIEPWYRYNALVFASDRGASRFPPAALETELAATQAVPELASLAWRVRNRLIQGLPRAVVARLVSLKHAAQRLGARYRR